MIFHNHQRGIINHIPKLESMGSLLWDCNFLGLAIDQHLTWNAHIQKISNKMSRSLGIMSRLKQYLPRNILRTIYSSVILPHLNYSVLVWGFKSSRIANLQKRTAHTEPLFNFLNLLKIEDIIKIKTLQFYYKYSQKNHCHFILMKCSPKLLIDTIMELSTISSNSYINHILWNLYAP